MISLQAEEEYKAPEISLEPAAEEPVNDLSAVADEVDRTDYALGDASPGPESINAYVMTNNSSALRDQVLAEQLLQDRRTRQEYISEATRQAAMEGRPLSVEDYEFFQTLTQEEMAGNRNTVFERMYANRLAREALQETEEHQELSDVEPELAQSVQFTAEDYITKQEITKRYITGLNTVYQQNGLLSNAWDIGRQFVPFYSALSQTGGETGVNQDVVGGRFFNPGGTKQAEYQALFFLPPEEFEAALKAKVDSVGANSTLEALVWLQGLLDYTSSNAAWDTAFNLVDIAGVVAPVVSKLGKTAGSLAKANSIPMNKTSRLVATGNTKQAAREVAFQRLNSKIVPESKTGVGPVLPAPTAQTKELMSNGPGILDPKVPMRDIGSLSNEAARRLTDGLTQDSAILLSTLDNVTNLTRIPEEAFVAGAIRAEERARKQYTKLEDGLIEILPVRESEEIFGGVDNIRLIYGKTDATPFKTEAQAARWAQDMYRLPKGSFEVMQGAGNNWFITIRKNIDETAREITDLRVATDSRAPENLVNTFIGYLRTPDDLLSKTETAARKQATYGANAILTRIREVAKSIGTLPGKQLKDLSDILSHSRFEFRDITLPDGTVTKVQGKFYDTVADLETAYMTRFKRLPSEEETRAYYAFRQISDLDYIQRNISVARDKMRLGLEQISFSASVPTSNGKFIYKGLDYVEAKVIDNLPEGNAGTYGVAWVDPKTGKLQFGLSDRLGKRYASLKEAIDSGNYKILQVANPIDETLRKLDISGGEPINYLVVRDIKTKPISSQQISYTEGGHWNYPTNNVYVKQPVTTKTGYGRRVYYGDKTAFAFTVPSLAKKIGAAMEEGRQMLVRGASKAELSAFVSKNLPFDVDEFVAQFRKPGEQSDAPFDLNTPFVVTDTGKRTIDVSSLDNMFGEAIVDGEAHSLMHKIGSTVDEATPAKTVRIEGSEANPQYRIDQAQIMNPMESLMRTASSLSSDRFFEDYKHISVENWAKQFSQALDVPQVDLAANPMKYLLDPKWKTGADAKHVAAAKNVRRSILQFIGFDNGDARAWKLLRQKTVDSIYKVRGQKGVDVLEPWLWDKATDPATLGRSAVFHAKLGFFNPIQFFTQASGALHVFAIDGNPVRSSQAVFGYWAMRMQQVAPDGGQWAGVNAKIAKALGLKPDVLDDMYLQYQRSGMNVVEGEYGLLDDYLNPKIFNGRGGRALDAGTFFFREGNNVHRGSAFAASYLKWREANPLAKVTAQDLQAIVDRADLMYINMSRASNSALQNPNSILSIPMQFFGYHVRMTEQLLGTRLTWPERLRLFGSYSLMWGVPVGIGGTTLGAFWPVNESVRQYMLEHGIDGDANVATQVLTKGLGSMLVQWATGEDYDVASRFGPGGMSWLKDIMDGDPMGVAGASPNFIGQVFQTAKPFLYAMGTVFNTDPATKYELKAEDFVDILKNISTVNNVTKAWAIYNAGQWTTKSGGTVANVNNDFINTVAIGLGLTPQIVQDAYIMLDSNTKAAEAQAQISREALVQFRRGLKAAADGDVEGMDSWFKRARALMIASGLDDLEASKVFRRALRENESMINQIGEDFMLNDPEVRQPKFIKDTKDQLNAQL